MKPALTLLVLLLFSTLAGLRAADPVPGEGTQPAKDAAIPAPFHAEFDPQGIGNGLKPRRLSEYDPDLPGFHVQAQIATLILRPGEGNPAPPPPERLVLVIQTSWLTRPMLENFTILTPDLRVTSALGGSVDTEEVQIRTKGQDTGEIKRMPRGTYLKFEVAGDMVRVTFSPKAMELLKKECKVQWIDWYR